MVFLEEPTSAKAENPAPPRVPRYTGKNRFTAQYDEHYDQYTVTIELDLMDDYDEPARVTKSYWRNAKHDHWIETFSGKVVAKGRNHHLWVFLNTLVSQMTPPQGIIDGIRPQVRKPR